jgi:hypothetical protein
MTDRKIFGLVVRLIGLYLAGYWGLLEIYSGLGCFASPSKAAGPYLIVGLACLITGIVLIKGNWLASFAYGRES